MRGLIEDFAEFLESVKKDILVCSICRKLCKSSDHICTHIFMRHIYAQRLYDAGYFRGEPFQS